MYRFSVRLPDEVKGELEFLCKLLNTSRNTLITNLIRSSYNQYADDPKIKQFMDNFKELQTVLDKFQAENN